MDEAGDENQERSKRIRKRFVLRASIQGEEPPRWSYCTIHNLSASGILFTYDRPIAIGARLHLRIDFPDRLVECAGQVTRYAGSGVGKARDLGVRFVQMHDLDQEYICRFVDNYRER